MRMVAVLPDESQASALLDSLRNIGFDRGDMIVSNLADNKSFNNASDAIDDGVSLIKTERDGLNDTGNFAEGIQGLKSERGIIIAVKTPKHETSKVREIMEQSGAVEIVQD